MESGPLNQLINFDIDRYINPWIPHNQLYVFPKPISRFLGYRSEPSKEAPPLLQWPVMFLATVAGLCLVAGITKYSSIREWSPPVLVASLGASAILDFNALRTPLAQPRNSLVGNTLSAIVGVAIAKLFQLNPDFENITWVAGAVGCACASLVMSITNTVHPPGGATAVLASTNMQVVKMGWRYVPLILLGSALLVTTGLLANNIFRQYPMYWWTPSKVGRQLRRERSEKNAAEGSNECGLKRTVSQTSSERTLGKEKNGRVEFVDGLRDLHITAEHIQMPSNIELRADELALLERLQERLASS